MGMTSLNSLSTLPRLDSRLIATLSAALRCRSAAVSEELTLPSVEAWEASVEAGEAKESAEIAEAGSSSPDPPPQALSRLNARMPIKLVDNVCFKTVPSVKKSDIGHDFRTVQVFHLLDLSKPVLLPNTSKAAEMFHLLRD